MVNHLTLGCGANSRSLCLEKAPLLLKHARGYHFATSTFFLTPSLPLVLPLQHTAKTEDCCIFVCHRLAAPRFA